MLSTPRAWLISSTFTLLFCALIGGIRLARVFLPQASIARARRDHGAELPKRSYGRSGPRTTRLPVQPLTRFAALIRIDPRRGRDHDHAAGGRVPLHLRASNRPHATGDELAFVREYLAIERTRSPSACASSSRSSRDRGAGGAGPAAAPLVENAVRYAVSPRSEGGEVASAPARGPAAQLTVSDDGRV